MMDGSEKKRLGVYAVVEREVDGVKKTFWPKLGVAFVNRDGSMNLFLESFPIGTNKLQIREIRDDVRPGTGGARRNGFDVVEVRP